jgi:hypothetical protein
MVLSLLSEKLGWKKMKTAKHNKEELVLWNSSSKNELLPTNCVSRIYKLSDVFRMCHYA